MVVLLARRAGGLRYVRYVSPTSLSYGSPDTSVNLAAVEQLLAAVRAELPTGGKQYFGTFPSEVRPEHVTPEALALIRRYADNRSLVIGGQTGSPRLLAATHRGHDVAAIERAVALTREAGLRPDVDFLFGCPTRPPTTARSPSRSPSGSPRWARASTPTRSCRCPGRRSCSLRRRGSWISIRGIRGMPVGRPQLSRLWLDAPGSAY